MKAARRNAVQLSFMARQIGHIYKPKMPSTLALPCYATMAAKPVKEYKVLSIDGGGVRGIIPARILSEIEKRTGKPISKLFDYVGGTSTGGILSLGLVTRTAKDPSRAYKAEELLELYQKNSSKIFHVPSISFATYSSLKSVALALILSMLILWQEREEISVRKANIVEFIFSKYSLLIAALGVVIGIQNPGLRARSAIFLSILSSAAIMIDVGIFDRHKKLLELERFIREIKGLLIDKERFKKYEDFEAKIIVSKIEETVQIIQEFVNKYTLKYSPEPPWINDGAFPAIFITLAGGVGYTLGAITRAKLNHLFMTKHNHQAVEALMKSYFGETKLNFAIKDAMVTSYDVKARMPAIFSRDLAQTNPSHDIYMWEAARATSAAPTYFNPYKKDGRVLVDGGIFVNNPSALMLANALRSQKKENVFFVSLGTGVYKPEETASFDGFGLMQWGLTGRMVRTMMEASSDAVDMEMQLHLGPENYKRVQLALHSPIPLDDASKETIATLNKLAEDYIKENSALIDEICQRLLNGPEVKKEQASSQAPVPGN